MTKINKSISARAKRPRGAAHDRVRAPVLCVAAALHAPHTVLLPQQYVSSSYLCKEYPSASYYSFVLLRNTSGSDSIYN